MSTYDENVRSYESFARGSLEASPGTNGRRGAAPDARRAGDAAANAAAEATFKPSDARLRRDGSDIGPAPLERIKRRAGLIRLVEGTDLRGRGPRADVAIVDAA